MLADLTPAGAPTLKATLPKSVSLFVLPPDIAVKSSTSFVITLVDDPFNGTNPSLSRIRRAALSFKSLESVVKKASLKALLVAAFEDIVYPFEASCFVKSLVVPFLRPAEIPPVSAISTPTSGSMLNASRILPSSPNKAASSFLLLTRCLAFS